VRQEIAGYVDHRVEVSFEYLESAEFPKDLEDIRLHGVERKR
jgi:hypothetical protein